MAIRMSEGSAWLNLHHINEAILVQFHRIEVHPRFQRLALSRYSRGGDRFNPNSLGFICPCQEEHK